MIILIFIQQILDMGQDVDDEEFLEIAIAMSLQDQEQAGNPSGEDGVNIQTLRGRALQTLQALSTAEGAEGGSSSQAK